MTAYTLTQAGWDAKFVRAEVERIILRMRNRVDALVKYTEERNAVLKERLVEKSRVQINAIQDSDAREVALSAATTAAELVAKTDADAVEILRDQANNWAEAFIKAETELAAEIQYKASTGTEIECRLIESIKEAHARLLAVEMAVEALYVEAAKNEARRISDAEIAAKNWAELLQTLTAPPSKT